MPEGPEDVVGQAMTKVLGGRSPVDFVPEILPKDIKSPRELTQGEPDGFSVKGFLRKFIPIDPAKVVGDIGEDGYRFARSLTPEHLIGARGEIDLPEPIDLNKVLVHPARGATREMVLPRLPGKGLPTPPLPPPPHEVLPGPWKK